MTRTFVSIVSLCIIATTAAAGEHWPQWRGPNRDGTSPASGVPTTWSETDNIAWTLSVSAGSWTGSTPIIWEDTIFLSVSHVERREAGFGRRGRRSSPDGAGPETAAPTAAPRVELWRVDRHDGSVVWKRFLSDQDRQQRKQNMSSPSPVTDGEHVWVMTGTGWLRAFDFEGRERWARNISDDLLELRSQLGLRVLAVAA